MTSKMAFKLHCALLASVHQAASRIPPPDQRSLLIEEVASRLRQNEFEEAKQHDYISIFGSQQNAIISYSETFSQTTAETSTEMTHQATENKTTIHSLHNMIEERTDLFATTDDPTSIMLLRREGINSFVDGLSEMDDSGPNARDVSNAFGSGPNSILNSFGA